MATDGRGIGAKVGAGLGQLGREAGHVVTRPGALARKAAESAKEAVSGAAGDVLEQADGAPGMLAKLGRTLMPGGKSGSDGGQEETGGTGKGRRMPVQQAVDVAAPLRTVYDQWTQFEEWPQFMHRVVQVTQEDDCTLSVKVKLWGMSREFEAEIDEQRPDERIAWHTVEGVSHSGVVTFHELAPRLTRVQVSLDVEPGSLIEKAARGMRHVKRAVRADLARFKAQVEMREEPSGGWRGTIRDGEVVAERDDQPAQRRARASGARARSRRRSDGAHAARSGAARRRTRR